MSSLQQTTNVLVVAHFKQKAVKGQTNVLPATNNKCVRCSSPQTNNGKKTNKQKHVLDGANFKQTAVNKQTSKYCLASNKQHLTDKQRNYMCQSKQR